MKKLVLFSFLIWGLSPSKSHAQWKESGDLKNFTWEYNFSGTGTVSGIGLEKISTPSVENFLPKPSSGEVKISTSPASATAGASFTLNDGTAPAITMVSTGANGDAILQPAPAKFSAMNFAASSTIMSAHFKVKLDNTTENVQAVWYIAVGDANNGGINSTTSPSISSRNGSADASGLYTLIRLYKTTLGADYTIQARWRGTHTTNWGWEAIDDVTIAKGVETKIDLFFNNSESTQEYTYNGTPKTIMAGRYHIYINDDQKGTGTTDAPRLSRNIGGSTSQYSYTGDLNGISIMSREGSHSGLFESDGTTRKYDNSASMVLSDLKVVHLTDETTMPVTLTSFTGNATNNGIALNWQTASEQNNSHFT